MLAMEDCKRRIGDGQLSGDSSYVADQKEKYGILMDEFMERQTQIKKERQHQ